MDKLIKLIQRSEKTHKIIGFIGFLFLCVFFVHNFYYGERIQDNSGWGWDGVYYAQQARTDPVVIIKEKQLNKYYAMRILPSFIVYYSSKLFGFSLGGPVNIMSSPIEYWEAQIKASEPQGVILAFYIYNCVLLLLGGWVWFLITKHYKWSYSVSLLSFFIIFMNYQVLKLSIFYPILTDISGMVMGILIFYLYLKDRIFSLIFVSFVGSFMWPTILYTSLLLVMFKVQKQQITDFSFTKFSNIFSGIVSVIMVVLTLYFSYSPGSFLSCWGFITQNTKYLILAAPLMALYIFLGLRKFVDLHYIYSQLKNNLNISRLLLAFLLFLSVKGILHFISNDAPVPFGTLDYLFFACRFGMLMPLWNVVFHTLDFGPGVLLIIFLWKDFVQVVKENGLGLMLFVFLYTFLSMSSESRQYIAGWPIFAILICEVINRRGVSWSFIGWVSILSLMSSRFWLTYDVNTWIGNVNHLLQQKFGMMFVCYVLFLVKTLVVIIYVLPSLKNSSNIGALKLLPRQFFNILRFYKTPRVLEKSC